MKKIIAANWKMNHAFDESDIWLDSFFKNFTANYDNLKNIEMVLCPPAVLLDYIDSELTEDSFQYLEKIMQHDNKKFEDFSTEELNKIILEQRPLKLGAQDCHYELKGSFTGDISAATLIKTGCQYVILGHYERRTSHFESDEIIARKIKAAAGQKLNPIICVGENQEIRNQGKHLEFIYRQIMNSIPQDATFDKMIIAYEPVWSIGTGIVPTPEQILEMAKLIKKIFAEEFLGRARQYFMLYGGSVTTQNSGIISKIEFVDGLLVGNASLDAEEFIKICLTMPKL
jgi:triosephosphate isomerase